MKKNLAEKIIDKYGSENLYWFDDSSLERAKNGGYRYVFIKKKPVTRFVADNTLSFLMERGHRKNIHFVRKPKTKASE